MAQYTENYNFTKPNFNDPADISVFNLNFDTVDRELKANAVFDVPLHFDYTNECWATDTPFIEIEQAAKAGYRIACHLNSHGIYLVASNVMLVTGIIYLTGLWTDGANLNMVTLQITTDGLVQVNQCSVPVALCNGEVANVGTEELTPGTSPLNAGTVYYVYE